MQLLSEFSADLSNFYIQSISTEFVIIYAVLLLFITAFLFTNLPYDYLQKIFWMERQQQTGHFFLLYVSTHTLRGSRGWNAY